jgi:hypothetical protein
MKVARFYLLLLPFLLSFSAPPKLVKMKVNDDLTISVPENFREMTDDEIVKFYLTSRKPAKVFCDPTRKVQIAVSSSDTPWGDDVNLLSKVYKKSILNTYPKVSFSKEEVLTVKKKKFALFEFVGEIEPEENAIKQQDKVSQYHMMLYAVHKEQIIVVNFNCPASLKKNWSETAYEIMKSVKFSSLI